MKKSFLFLAAAALALASCNNDVTVAENQTLANEPQEIAFSPVSNPVKRAPARAAVLDGNFPTTSDIILSAYDKTNSRTFFEGKTFKYQYVGGSSSGSGSTWGAETTPIYWPLSQTTINFLGYANKTGSSADTWTNGAQQVVIPMADNSSSQNDLMYAVGQGKVTQVGNTLSFPSSVPMVFKHAQALMQFNVKGTAAAVGKITITAITLNNAYFSGTLTVNNGNNYNVDTDPTDPTSVAWSSISDQKATLSLFSGSYALTSESTKKAEVMVVPQAGPTISFDGFSITYTLDEKSYTYTYTPANRVMAMATKYVYDITFDLHEIFVSPSVTQWTDGGTEFVSIPSVSTEHGTNISITANAAGTYTVYVTGLGASAAYTVATTDGSSILAAAPAVSGSADANGVATISFKAKAATATASATIVLTKTEGSTTTTITVNQTAS